MSNRKHRTLVWGITALLVIALMMAGCQQKPADTSTNAPSTNVPSTNVPEPTDPEQEQVVLFYNVDGTKYAGLGEDGKTSRPVDADSGYYIVQFASKGRLVQRRVLNIDVATKVDNQSVMALVLNEDGIVSDIQTVDECTGGYYLSGKKVYVSAVEGNTLTVFGNKDKVGGSYQLQYTADTKIYDVSEMAVTKGTVGNATDVQKNDELLVILNEDESVGWIYVTERRETRTYYCEHCKQEIDWVAWDSNNAVPVNGEGHFYLKGDVALTAQANVETDANIVLDLNGHTVTQTEDGKRIYSLRKNCSATLSILDTSTEQTGKMVVSGNSTNQGRVIYVEGSNHTVNLYSGTLDASASSGSIGLGICCQVENSTINMYGGTIIGGTNEGSGTSVRIDKAVFNMYGGTIKDGHGKNGGNLFVSKNGIFNLYDGVIEGGSASGKSGNVAVGGDGVMFMYGGTIKNGTTPGNGGNVLVNGTFTMEGGTIEGGTATGSGNNVYVVKDKTFTLIGGTLDTSDTSFAQEEGAIVTLPQ